MIYNRYDSQDNADKLDGALINVDTDKEILTANKNLYFLAATILAVGAGLIGYGIYKYFNGGTIHDSAYVLCVLGGLMFLVGLTAILKAAIYLWRLKPFLKKAKYTKCNIEWAKEVNKGGKRKDSWSFVNYILRVEYRDDHGEYRKKTVKWGIAHHFCAKVLKNNSKCHDPIIAYNPKGKIVLIYKYDIVQPD